MDVQMPSTSTQNRFCDAYKSTFLKQVYNREGRCVHSQRLAAWRGGSSYDCPACAPTHPTFWSFCMLAVCAVLHCTAHTHARTVPCVATHCHCRAHAHAHPHYHHARRRNHPQQV